MAAAQIALWARDHSLTRAGLQAALWTKRTLVKTSLMRSTLHLVPASEFSIYIQALKQGRLRHMRRVMAKYGAITPALADEVTKAVVEAVGDEPMPRKELTERIFSLGIVRGKPKKWFQLGWWGVARQAIMEGRLCYGPDNGQEVTFVRVDHWLPKQKRIEEAEAQRILLGRYLRAYGPATPQDFSRWTGMTMQEVRPVWDSVAGKLAEVSVEGRGGFILLEDLEHLHDSDPAEPVLRLLPSFDPYLLGHAKKDHVVERRFYLLVYRKAGWISPVILLNGRAIGTWSHERKGKGLSVEVRPFEKLSKSVGALIEKEAESLAGFLEARCEVKFVN